MSIIKVLEKSNFWGSNILVLGFFFDKLRWLNWISLRYHAILKHYSFNSFIQAY